MHFGTKDCLPLLLREIMRKMKKADLKKKQAKKDIDNLAAAFILEGAINYIMKSKY